MLTVRCSQLSSSSPRITHHPLGNDIRINLTDIYEQQPKIKPHLSSPIHQSPKRSTPSKRERTRSRTASPSPAIPARHKKPPGQGYPCCARFAKTTPGAKLLCALHTRNGIAFFFLFFSCENEKTRPPSTRTHKKKEKKKIMRQGITRGIAMLLCFRRL